MTNNCPQITSDPLLNCKITLLLFINIVTLLILMCLKEAELQDQSHAALLADKSRLVLLSS